MDATQDKVQRKGWDQSTKAILAIAAVLALLASGGSVWRFLINLLVFTPLIGALWYAGSWVYRRVRGASG